MNWFRPIGIAGLAWRSAADHTGRISIWSPLLVVAFAELAAIALVASYHATSMSTGIAAVIERMIGAQALHYPDLFYALPTMLGTVQRVLLVLLGSIASAVVTLRFARAFGAQLVGGDPPVVRRYAPALIALAAIEVASVWGLSKLGQLLPASIAESLAGSLTIFLLGTLGFLIRVGLAFALAWMVIGRRSLVRAIAASLKLSSMALAPTILLVGAPELMLAAMRAVMAAPRQFGITNAPELMLVLILSFIGVHTILDFIRIGAITRLFLSRTGTHR